MMRSWLKVALVSLLVLVTAGLGHSERPGNAQTDAPPVAPRMLVSGVDVNGQGFPISLVSLGEARADTLATFANRPVCPPAVFPDGGAVLYELVDPAGQPFVYRIDVDNRTRELVLEPALDNLLACPQIAPDGERVAWSRHNVEGDMSLVLTTAALTPETALITHPTIYDIQWSPGGAALIYTVIDTANPFPTLYSIPRQGAPSPRTVFASQNGLLHDYQWTTDSSGLIIAYYTDEHLALAVLSTACVIGPGDPCEIEPIATFPFDNAVNLTAAYSADNQQVVVVLQSGATTPPQTDLYMVTVDSSMEPQQLTDTPDIIENDVYWDVLNDRLYFTGSRYDVENEVLRGAIYLLDLNLDEPPQIVFSSDIFSPAQILWWYQP